MSVFLVGAGPGDSDLLTLRAAQLLARADVVVHDRLVSEEILALLPPSTLRVDVGKLPGDGSSQRDINELLIDLARDYESVVRLKGGDPFVFGRGGEEALALREAGIEVQVVPGISSAFAAPLLAGIAVTHRGSAHGVCVVTATGEAGSDVDFTRLANEDITLVVLMGVARRARVAEELRRGGLAAATPIAVVENASTPQQRVLRGRLDELGDLEVTSPAVIVIGHVAGVDLGLSTLLESLVTTS